MPKKYRVLYSPSLTAFLRNWENAERDVRKTLEQGVKMVDVLANLADLVSGLVFDMDQRLRQNPPPNLDQELWTEAYEDFEELATILGETAMQLADGVESVRKVLGKLEDKFKGYEH